MLKSNKIRITLDLDKDFYALLKQIAKEHMLSVSSFIRLAVKEKIEALKNAKKEG